MTAALAFAAFGLLVSAVFTLLICIIISGGNK